MYARVGLNGAHVHEWLCTCICMCMYICVS